MEKTINIAICDDEASTLDIMRSVCQSFFDNNKVIANIQSFKNPNDLLETIRKFHFDLLFLDINLNGKDGIDLSKEIQNIDSGIKTVFVSSHEDRVFDSLTTHPYGFVRKANFINDFNFIGNSFLKEGDQQVSEHKVFIKGKQTQAVDTSNIIYIESDGKYQTLHLNNSKEVLRVRQNMNDFDNELSNFGFIRIHKCYLVNSEFISVINKDNLILKDNTKLVVSKRKAPEIRDKYLMILKDRKQAILINSQDSLS